MTRRSSSRNPKTPSTLDKTGYDKSGLGSANNADDDDAYTPEQFKATASMAGMTTDEQGNRLSILPGSSRPSKKRPDSQDKNKAIAGFAIKQRDSSSREESKGPKKTVLEQARENIATQKEKQGD